MYFQQIRKVLLLSTSLIILLGLLFFIVSSFRSHRYINFAELSERGNINELTLTIYYLPRNVLTPFALTVEELTTIEYFDTVRTVVSDLGAYMDILRQLDTIVLIPVEREHQLMALLHYEFNFRGQKFTVTGWGQGDSLIVNGVEVEEHYIFYEVILPFLTGRMQDALSQRIELLRSR